MAQHSRPSRITQTAARQRLEAQEARLNPALDDDDDEIVDPFGCANDDGPDEGRLAKLRLMFHWTPQRLH